MNTTNIQRDIVIIGAGIAGLWLHARLKQLGLHTLIIENKQLGSGQTIASQGIIHGGTKYTLTGKITAAAQSLTDMPRTWRHAITSVTNTPDLSTARILAEHQFLCSDASLASKFTAFAAGKVIQAKVTALTRQHHPAFLDHQSFRGNAYQLDEPVIDVSSVLQAFQNQTPAGEILLVDEANGFTIESDHQHPVAVINLQHSAVGAIRIHTPHLIFTAGLGNEMLAPILRHEAFKTQRRPLQMTLARFPAASTDQFKFVYSHFLGRTALPRATITTHFTKNSNQIVLYIGGEIAETGINRSRSEQIAAAKKLLTQILPAVPLQAADWATYPVDRAEPLQQNNQRPDNAIFTEYGNIIAAWPTKLALAPYLADEIATHLQTKTKSAPRNSTDHPEILKNWPRPTVAPAPWDQEDLIWTK